MPRTSVTGREQAINDLGEQLFADLAAGSSDDLVLKAVVHTARSFDLDPDCFRRFLRAMTNSLTVTSYDTFDDLLDYMDGSAAVIGELLLPILEPSTDAALRTRGTSRSRAGSPSAGAMSPATSTVAASTSRRRICGATAPIPGSAASRRSGGHSWRSRSVARTSTSTRATGSRPSCLPVPARCVRMVRDLHVQMLDRIDRVGADVFTTRAERPAVAHRGDRGAPLATEKRRDPAVGSAHGELGAHAIEVAALEKRYGDTRAVDGLTFSIADRRGLRAARAERRGQDHDRRDPRGLPPRRRRRRCACSALDPWRDGAAPAARRSA